MRVQFAVLVVALVAVAGCSSQAGSSGAVQDDAAASAASTMASPAASAMPSADGGAVASPSTAASTAASAMASPAASQEAPPMLGMTAGNNDVCDTGLAYDCGDTGESGVGIVFYASATPFACGPDLASTCNFLEVAPNLWNPNSASKCPGKDCGGSSQQTSDVTGTGKGITMCTGPLASNPSAWPTDEAVGAGYANTTVWITGCNSYDAPNAARAYQGGGKTDWSLPSFSELNALYYYPNRNDIGGFTSWSYWSSSGLPAGTLSQGMAVVSFASGGACFAEGTPSCDSPVSTTAALRPVRAF